MIISKAPNKLKYKYKWKRKRSFMKWRALARHQNNDTKRRISPTKIIAKTLVKNFIGGRSLITTIPKNTLKKNTDLFDIYLFYWCSFNNVQIKWHRGWRSTSQLNNICPNLCHICFCSARNLDCSGARSLLQRILGNNKEVSLWIHSSLPK